MLCINIIEFGNISVFVMDFLNNLNLSDLATFLAGSGISAVILKVVDKIKSKGEKRNEFADFLDKINTLFSNTINTVENTYKSIIDSEKAAVEMANKNFEMSQLREERQLTIINNERIRSDKLEGKNAKKRAIINQAYECDIVKQSSAPAEVCAVLKANAKYYNEKQEAKKHQCNNCLTEIKS